MKQKSRKSILKRFKITKNGKILRRAVGQDHNLAKKSNRRRRQMRKWIELSKPETKVIKKLIAY